MSLDAQSRSFVDMIANNPKPGWEVLGVAEARKSFGLLQEFFGTLDHSVRVVDGRMEVENRQPRSVAYRSYLPDDLDMQAKGPLIVFLHGGGWVLGDVETHHPLCTQIAATTGQCLVSIDYPRAPECQYPITPILCAQIVPKLLRNAVGLPGPFSSCVVVGDSAGGHLAVDVADRLSRDESVHVSGCLPIYPVVRNDFTTLSYRQCGEGHGLTKAAMKWFWTHYLGDQALVDGSVQPPGFTHDLLSRDYRRFPRTHVVTAGYDVLRDEGVALVEVLAKDGVHVTSQHYPSVLHGFIHMSSLFDQGREAIDELCDVLKSMRDTRQA
ncbi:MAG: alpha/beta hydrolase [Planctomycetota bacterium]